MNPDIPRVARGQRITADLWNRGVSAVDALNRVPAVREVSYGNNPSGSAGSGSGATTILRGTVVTENNDTLTVTPFGGGGNVTVWKPIFLRGSIDTRVLSGETQFIIPGYFPGAPIFYMMGVVGGDLSGAQDENDLIDINWDARAWGAEFIGS